MGYTNYWYQYDDFTKDEWHQIKVFYHGLILVHGGGAYLEADHIIIDETNGGDHIQFNATANTFDVQVGSLELDASNIEISSTNGSI